VFLKHKLTHPENGGSMYLRNVGNTAHVPTL
jgi:hypothetical protein